MMLHRVRDQVILVLEKDEAEFLQEVLMEEQKRRLLSATQMTSKHFAQSQLRQARQARALERRITAQLVERLMSYLFGGL